MDSFTDYYGARYYAFVLTHLLIASIIYFLHDGILGFLTLRMVYLIGNFLSKDTQNIKQASYHNRRFVHMIPPILSCIQTPIILAIFWIQYEELTQTILGTIGSFICLVYMLSPSIDAAHQLMHRPEPICKFFCFSNLWFFQFTTYPIEHLYLHHKKVGSLEDPVTAPKNFSVYKYFVKVLFASYQFNYQYSKKIFSFCILSTLTNILTIIYLATREGGIWFGKSVYFVAFSYASMFLMESIQYIEHYGLIFRKDGDEKPVGEISSWNSVENSLLNSHIFRFQRHSDHHMNAYKIYSTLELNEKMPLLPFDFSDAVLLSFTPNTWYQVMNPYVDQALYGTKLPEGHEQLTKNTKSSKKVIALIIFLVYVAYTLI